MAAPQKDAGRSPADVFDFYAYNGGMNDPSLSRKMHKSSRISKCPAHSRTALFFCGLILAFLTACAPPRPLVDATLFNREDAAEVFSAGFEGITSFYIEETDLPSLAVAGLSGLQSLDNTISITDRGELIVIAHNEHEIGACRERLTCEMAWTLYRGFMARGFCHRRI